MYTSYARCAKRKAGINSRLHALPGSIRRWSRRWSAGFSSTCAHRCSSAWRALDAPVDALLVRPHAHTHADLVPELASVVAELAHVSPAYQRQLAARLRADIATLPTGVDENTEKR